MRHRSTSHRSRSSLVASLLALAPPISAATAPTPGAADTPPPIVAPVPPQAIREDAKTLLSKLLAIDTTHDAGTGAAVELLAARLREAGFTDDDLWIVGPRKERWNLVARLRAGASSANPLKPILFLAHLDVVEAKPEDWTVDPFRLTETNGWLYGRGTLDIKAEAVDLLESFVRLKREGFLPSRDLILALTADEEAGGGENGVQWLLTERKELVDVAYAMNTDAGGLQWQKGALVRMPIQTSEKVYLTFDVETTSPGGHSSLPTKDNAIYRLATALGKLERHPFPVELNDGSRLFFQTLAAREKGELAAAFRGILAEPPASEAIATLSEIPLYNSTLRTVCSPTMLTAGHAENALPQRANATLQCRLLPWDEPEAVRRALIETIGDPTVMVTPRGTPSPAPASPIEPALFEAVRATTDSCWPGVPILPVMDPWGSDCSVLRRGGIACYGISGLWFDVDDVRSHGQDERIALAAFDQAMEFTYRLMKNLGAPRPPR